MHQNLARQPVFDDVSVLIDQQHQNLLQLANMAKRFNEFRMDSDSVKLVFDQLVQHTKDHFDLEENQLRVTNQSAYYEHKFAHDEVRHRIALFYKRNNLLSYNLMMRAINILLEHLEAEI
ncbi:hemerythrin family protein [Paramagnetospirillum kuznetsovii]|uniref:hemerythrin family protein n=1 Tax=Paramagnetospirillum kuznetsovii TaxID=2053833 RepID=UPI0011BE6B4D|nr:hemerythrin family protein [Paramagnetospirillum kuznetsovii]